MDWSSEGHALLPLAFALGVVLTGCALERSGLGLRVDSGAPPPRDATVDSGFDPDAELTDSGQDAGPGVVVVSDDSHADFLGGSFGTSTGRLYARAGGEVAGVIDSDLDGDGFQDAVIPVLRDATGRLNASSEVLYGGVDVASPRTASISTTGAVASMMSDLDADGCPDVVLIAHQDAMSAYATDSILCPCLQADPACASAVRLPTSGALDVDVGDFNGDGFLDLFVVNGAAGDPGSRTRDVPSYIYYGGSSGFDAGRRDEVRTVGAIDACVGDFDADGYADIFVAQHDDGRSSHSLVVRGAASGLGVASPWLVPTGAARGCAVADVDADGHLDIVFAHASGVRLLSGSSTGLSSTPQMLAAMIAPFSVQAGDLDDDGDLDLFLSSPSAQTDGVEPNRILWNEGSTWTVGPGFRAESSWGAVLGDWNGDGSLDAIVGSSVDSGGSWNHPQTVYWGAGRGPVAPAALARGGVLFMRGPPTANLHDRRMEEQFVSRVLDLTTPAARVRIGWESDLPAGATLLISARAAADPSALAATPWSAFAMALPLTLDTPGARYVQYRAVFQGTGNLPVLRRVTVTGHLE